MTVNGHEIAEAEIGLAWGVSPAGAKLTIPGDASGSFDTEDEVSIALGGSLFTGYVTRCDTETLRGRSTVVELVDRRYTLSRDTVFGYWNRVEIVDDNFDSPGIDRTRRFVHVYPDDWGTQHKTIDTRPPLGLGDVLRSISNNSNWRFEMSSSISSTQLLDIDCNEGKKMSAIISEICDRLGLEARLATDGTDTLELFHRGDGPLPSIPRTAYHYSTGIAVSNQDTCIGIVGDRCLFQDNNVQLTGDWAISYEELWFEPTWIARVDAAYGPFSSEADLFFKARSLTVREFAATEGSAYADRRRWGEISRMELPVWIYLRDIVFKAYRVPRSYTLAGIPLEDLELEEGLLQEVEFNSSGQMAYSGENYPDDRAFVIVQGIDVALVDAKHEKTLDPGQIDNLREQWTANNRFNLDRKNYAIIFESAVVQAGSGSDGLFVFPNRDVGLSEGSPLYDVAVPNAAAELSEANVRASLTFSANRFYEEFGSGTRFGTQYVGGISQHMLYQSGSVFGEVAYEDGEIASLKAQRAAATLIARQDAVPSGFWKRKGAASTSLSAVIGRVTVTLRDGLEEHVEFSSERNSRQFDSPNELRRRERSKELFPGQRTHREELYLLRTLSRLAPLKRDAQAVVTSPTDVVERPHGSPEVNPTYVKLPDDVITLGGQPLLRGRESGEIESGGSVFAGIAVCQNGEGRTPIATHGIVPCRVMGSFRAGDLLGTVPNEDVLMPYGGIRVGYAMTTYTGIGVVTAPVRLGAEPLWPAFSVFVSAMERTETGEVVSLAFRVELDSWLMKSENWDDKVTISGLGTDIAIDDPDEKIWLEIAVTSDTFEIDSATIVNGLTGEGEDWDNFPTPVGWDDATSPSRKQQTYRHLLAYFASSAGDYAWPAVSFPDGSQRYLVNTTEGRHLVSCRKCYEPGGVVARVTSPWFKPYLTL
jgi:hypothetical protein